MGISQSREGSSRQRCLCLPPCLRSTTSSTSSSCDGGGELSKAEEQRLREHLVQLRGERAAVRATLLELESVHVEPRGASTLLDAHKLDLENAVLMQELMAIKVGKEGALVVCTWVAVALITPPPCIQRSGFSVFSR